MAVKPAAFTALIRSCADTPDLAWTTALLGIVTTTLETPFTFVSADCTFFAQLPAHFMPETFSVKVLVSASVTTFCGAVVGAAIAAPIGSAAKAHSAMAFVYNFIF